MPFRRTHNMSAWIFQDAKGRQATRLFRSELDRDLLGILDRRRVSVEGCYELDETYADANRRKKRTFKNEIGPILVSVDTGLGFIQPVFYSYPTINFVYRSRPSPLFLIERRMKRIFSVLSVLFPLLMIALPSSAQKVELQTKRSGLIPTRPRCETHGRHSVAHHA